MKEFGALHEILIELQVSVRMLLLASPLQPLSMSSIGTMEDSDFNDLFFPCSNFDGTVVLMQRVGTTTTPLTESQTS